MAIVKVKNRNNGNTGYKLDDERIRRNFAPGEEKEIESSELIKLTYTPGGMYMLKNYLIILDEKVRESILGQVEPEYNYTEKEILALLEYGTEDQLRDCLEFAPDGVKELVKSIAVDISLYDTRKRKIISDYFNFDLNSAIDFREESKNLNEDVTETSPRRSEPIKFEEEPATTPIRTAPSYKVVN